MGKRLNFKGMKYRICTKCGYKGPHESFGFKNKPYRLSYCKACRMKMYHKNLDAIYADPVRLKKYTLRKRLQGRKTREDNLKSFRERERNSKRAKGWANIKVDPFKAKARYEVKNAILNGVIKKPKSCPVCKNSKDRIEAHHTDYSKPLKIKWRCSICHGKEHRLK